MAWPATTAGSILSGKGVKTLGIDLWDRDAIVAAAPWTWATAHGSFTTVLITEATGFFRMPVWSEEAAVLTITFTAVRDGAVSGDCDFRIRGRKGAAGFTNGGTLTTAITTSIAPYEVSLTVAAAVGWEGEMVEIQFQALHAASGADADWQVGMQNVMGNCRIVPISP